MPQRPDKTAIPPLRNGRIPLAAVLFLVALAMAAAVPSRHWEIWIPMALVLLLWLALHGLAPRRSAPSEPLEKDLPSWNGFLDQLSRLTQADLPLPLQARLRTLYRQAKQLPPPAHSPAPLLLITPDPALRATATAALQQAGLQTMTAADADEALAYDPDPLPGLILLDARADTVDPKVVARRLGTEQPLPVLRIAGPDQEIAMPDPHLDPLTHLPDRSCFLHHLENALRLALRRNERFSLLYLDLDSFKDINDTLGHDMGDRLLRVVARRLSHALRQSDFAARLGGDEFCILLDGLIDGEAAKVAERCLAEINRPLTLGDQTFHPRISVGIASFPRDGRSAGALLKAADSAMYAAKREGKHRYAFYRPELTRRAHERLRMEQDLRKALEREELWLEYQPQIDLTCGRVRGVEALVRWNHPERGRVSPGEFIPVAERIGLIRPLGEWVLFQACRQLQAWREAGLPRLTLAVNISPLHFADPTIVDRTRAILEDCDVPPELLELEVTESVVQTASNLAHFRRLKALGVRIAIDDFGTGYSSLASLKQLPLDLLKIDQLFVHDMVTDPASATLVGTIIGMARALGLEVVAEGVEEAEQLQILVALGCDHIQGYHFSPPVPAAEIPALVQRPCPVPPHPGAPR